MPQETWESATPVKRMGKSDDLSTLVDVEKRLMACDDALAELQDEIQPATKKAIESERAWLKHRDPIVIKVFHSDKRSGEDVRDAMARQKDAVDGTTGEELWQAYRAAQSLEKAVHMQIGTIQSRQSGLQTLARTLRKASGLE